MSPTRHSMRFSRSSVLAAAVLIVAGFSLGSSLIAGVSQDAEPEHPVIVAAPAGQPPSDAVVLFSGGDISAWTGRDGTARWKVEGDYMEVNGSGNVWSTQEFGDCQIHLEFRTPDEAKGDGQGRGNSGVYVQGRYEVQVLDSYGNQTYSNGQCGAIYGQYPPLVNACRGPGEWQTYDIVFRAAKFDEQGEIVQRPTMTVFHNGVLIQDHAEIKGTTAAAKNNKEDSATGPLMLQDHGNPVRYRNVWVRPL